MNALLPFPLHWHTEPLLIGGLLIMGWGYALLIGPLRFIWLAENRSFAKEIKFFYAAILIAYLAVGSPLDQLGEDFLFSLHMLQHLIITLLVAFCFIKSVPTVLIDKILSKNPIVLSVVRFLTHPAIASISFTLIYSLWHIPSLYEAALSDKRVHILEHLLMLLVAIQMFWPLISSSLLVPRSTPPVRMLYIVSLMIGQFPVFGMLTLSQEPLYITYTLAPRIVPWTPLQDQVLGGILMNIIMMGAMFTFFAHSFYQWYQLENKKTQAYAYP